MGRKSLKGTDPCPLYSSLNCSERWRATELWWNLGCFLWIFTLLSIYATRWLANSLRACVIFTPCTDSESSRGQRAVGAGLRPSPIPRFRSADTQC